MDTSGDLWGFGELLHLTACGTGSHFPLALAPDGSTDLLFDAVAAWGLPQDGFWITQKGTALAVGVPLQRCDIHSGDTLIAHIRVRGGLLRAPEMVSSIKPSYTPGRTPPQVLSTRAPSPSPKQCRSSFLAHCLPGQHTEHSSTSTGERTPAPPP